MKENKTISYEIIGAALLSISNITRVDIIRYLQRYSKASFKELRTEFNLNNNTLRFHLRKLQDAYIVSQPKKRGYYMLGELGEVILRTREDLEHKCLPILKKIIEDQ